MNVGIEEICGILEPMCFRERVLSWSAGSESGNAAGEKRVLEQILVGKIGEYRGALAGSLLAGGLDFESTGVISGGIARLVDLASAWRNIDIQAFPGGEGVSEGAVSPPDKVWLAQFVPSLVRSLTELRARAAVSKLVAKLVEEHRSLRVLSAELEKGYGRRVISSSYLGRLHRGNVRIPARDRARMRIWILLDCVQGIGSEDKLAMARDIFPDIKELEGLTVDQFGEWLGGLVNGAAKLRQGGGFIETVSMDSTGTEIRLVARGFADRVQAYEDLARMFTSINEKGVKVRSVEVAEDS